MRFQQFILLIFLIIIAAAISDTTVAKQSILLPDAGGLYQFYFPYTANVAVQTNCRYGVIAGSQQTDHKWLSTLGAGHYINFTTTPEPEHIPENVEFLYQIRISQVIENGEYQPRITIVPPLTMDADGLGPIVLANPGKTWLVGNEQDVPNVVQDNMLPSTYAWGYWYVYNFIKKLDPTARIANGGLSMATPGRLQYLDIVWNTYIRAFGERMPVDVWNTHLYILSEIRPWDGGNSDGKVAIGTDPALAIKAPHGPAEIECPKDDVYCRAEHDDIDIFAYQIRAMRQWMKNHGEQNKPLLLTEFSQLYPFVDYDDPVNPTHCYLMDEYGGCFTQERVSTFMKNVFNYLETAKDPALGYPGDDYRLVQQWTWYSTWTVTESTGSSSNLLVKNYTDFSPSSPAALTEVGRTYRDWVFTRMPSINLVAGEAAHVQVKADAGSGTANAQISLGFFNNGTAPITRPFVVVFYKDEALTQVIAGIQVTPEEVGGIQGCSWGQSSHWSTTTWSNLPVGTHTYWAKVDNRNDIRGETSEKDNVITGQVIVTP